MFRTIAKHHTILRPYCSLRQRQILALGSKLTLGHAHGQDRLPVHKEEPRVTLNLSGECDAGMLEAELWLQRSASYKESMYRSDVLLQSHCNLQQNLLTKRDVCPAEFG